ncbi:HTH-type transcriptional activator IlvY [Aliikangiella sp. G2MR2-5]|uniref:HTH-type transcriptional activator IlvY n=1 Tax=Aliikangiella sp. G2MR2-5 TaxID=2788943 RepID=UPI0018A9558E|nr:HTH-type transcriptional activator IlvY [Aliikangiella sp. G2MR2-5]
MNIKDLQAFIHLTQNLNFNQTANEIHTSPSTLSRMIQRLESEFEQVFFERDNRRVALTKAGARFRLFAEKVLLEWRQLKSEFDLEQKELHGEISIYCTVTAAHLYLPGLLEKFRKFHPKVEIKLETGDVSAAYHKVEAGEADFAFAVANESLASKFEFHHLRHIPFKVIAPKQSNQAGFLSNIGDGKINWTQLPFVMPEAGPAQKRVKEWLKKMALKPEIYAQVSGHEAIVSMVSLGCGISVVPEPVLELSPARERVQVLPAPFLPRPFDLGILSLKKKAAQPLITAFWSLVREEY